MHSGRSPTWCVICDHRSVGIPIYNGSHDRFAALDVRRSGKHRQEAARRAASDRSMLFPLSSLVCAVIQPSPLRHVPVSNVTADTCAAYEAEIVQRLSTVRGRVGPREAWLANFFVPNHVEWSAARDVARTHTARGCAQDIELASRLHNLRLALSPCLTQCEASDDVEGCYNAACNTSLSRPSFELLASECDRGTASPLLPLLKRGLCDRLEALRDRVDNAARLLLQSSGAPSPAAHGPSLKSVLSCRTMFGEPCCPQMKSTGLVCGGQSRGECVPMAEFLARSRRPSGTCEWPLRYAAFRCACRANFAGASCDGCAAGWQGAECTERRPKEVRRDLSTLTAAERATFFAALREASQASEWKALEASHEFGLSLYHETSHLVFSHHASIARARTRCLLRMHALAFHA